MEIRIAGKFEPNNRALYTKKEIDQIPWIGQGFVFVEYLLEDIFLGDEFILADGTEITLREIKLQIDSKEPMTMMSRGWKCLCKFDNLDLNKILAIRDWLSSENEIIAIRK